MLGARSKLGVLALGFLLPLAGACNSIWGIDAPILVGGDGGGGDGPSSDGPGDARRDVKGDRERDARKDGHVDAARDAPADSAHDAMAEATPPDAPSLDAPEGFDGNCPCDGSVCAPITIASGQAAPTRIVTDKNGVYWTNGGTVAPKSGAVVAATFDGKITPLAVKQSNPFGIAVASGNLVWDEASLGSVELCVLPGCSSPVTLASSIPGVGEVAVDSTDVFFEALSSIDTCPLGGCGGPPTMMSSLGGHGGIALDGASVYWADTSAGTIQSCPLAGCPGTGPTVLTTGETSPDALVTAAGQLFWTDSAGEIRACPITSCDFGKTSLVPGGTYIPLHLAADAKNVYFTDESGFVARVAVTGGSPVNLESGEPSPAGIALGATCVFWADNPGGDGGTIRATGK